jgi:formylglycine-generating enzyme required for sulfatase activity
MAKLVLTGKPNCDGIVPIRKNTAGKTVMTKKSNIAIIKRNSYLAYIRFALAWAALALLTGIQPVLAQTIPLSIALAGNQVVLTWPAAATNCFLQSTTNFSPAAWSNVPAAPVVISGQYTLTNPICGTQQFYQLSQIAIPSGMALIPAGSFTMGDTLDDEGDAIPISVTVSAFYMDSNHVTVSFRHYS